MLNPFVTTALPYLGDFVGSSQTLLSGCHSDKPQPNPYKCTTYPVGLLYGIGAGHVRVQHMSPYNTCELDAPSHRFAVLMRS